LSDTVRNVQTHDFNYRDAAVQRTLLPGELAANPPLPWSGAAISAHANATEVAEFLVTVLRRDGLDNMGGPFISSINCTFLNNNPSQREWRNAAWIGTQMIYGQREVAGQLQSYALAKDVVAHEIIHASPTTQHGSSTSGSRERSTSHTPTSLASSSPMLISPTSNSGTGRWGRISTSPGCH
jgi:Zn-dependent metalloprotease